MQNAESGSEHSLKTLALYYAVMFVAILILVAFALGLKFLLDIPLPPYYPVFFLGSSTAILLSIATLAIIARFPPIPERWWTQAFVLAAYSWPFQVTFAWIVLDWPTTLKAAIQFGGFIVGLLSCCGLAWFIRSGQHINIWKKTLVLSLVLLGLTIPLAGPPIVVYLDGLHGMAQIPQVREVIEENNTVPHWDGKFPTLFVHLSDTHITGSNPGTTFQGYVSGDALLPEFLDQTDAAPLVFLTGDITDSGAVHEWLSIEQLLKNLSERSKVILAPGNHDTSISYSLDALDGTNNPDYRIIQFLRLQVLLDEVRARYDPNDLALQTFEGKMLREVIGPEFPNEFLENRHMQFVREFASLASHAAARAGVSVDYYSILRERYTIDHLRIFLTYERLKIGLDQIFPIQWHSSDQSTHVFVLDSSSPPSRFLGSSALGMYGEVQLERLEKLLQEASDEPRTRTIIILSHHPLVRPPNVTTKSIFEFGKLQLNPKEALQLISILRKTYSKGEERDIEVLACYGHRHKRYLGIIDGIHMIEAPSVPSLRDGESGTWVGYRVNDKLKIGWKPFVSLP